MVTLSALSRFYREHRWEFSAACAQGAKPFGEPVRGLQLTALSDGVLFGTLLLSATGEILSESVIYPALAAQLPRGESDILSGANRLQGSFVTLDGVYAEYFWHWVMEYLPRVILSEERGFSGRYLIRRDSPYFVKESLALLGIDEGRIVERGGETVVLEELVVPPALTGTPGHGRADITQFPELLLELRGQLLSAIQGEASSIKAEQIYLSRRNAVRGRRIRNESELYSVLKEFGVKSFEFETLSLKEQLAISSGAKTLIGPHGAGMVHTLFQPEKSTVVELLSPNFRPDTNHFIHTLLGHRYLPLAGVADPADDGVPPNLQDITIDPLLASELLRSIQ